MGVPLWLQVIGTALALGVVHVLTGPDHLSALSTLSVGKPLRTAFGLGVRWGCGHSFGLLIVAIIFFAVGQSIDLTVLSFYADIFVGIFMILLGAWYTLKAFRERMKYLQEKEDKDKDIENLLQKESLNIDNNNNNNNNYDMNMINLNDIKKENEIDINNEEQIELQQIDDNDDRHNNHHHDDNDDDNDNSDDPSLDRDNNKKISDNDESDGSTKEHSEQHQLKNSYQNGHNGHIADNDDDDDDDDDDIIPDDDIIIDGNASLNPLFDKDEDHGRTKCITRLAAFIAGIFHGVAGPGGVLGVMVALKLNDWFLSTLYLILFFISSIVTMGIYAIIYGFCTQRMTVCANNKQKCAYILKTVSAIFSLIIGVLWLSLTFTGTLEDIFD